MIRPPELNVNTASARLLFYDLLYIAISFLLGVHYTNRTLRSFSSLV